MDESENSKRSLIVPLLAVLDAGVVLPFCLLLGAAVVLAWFCDLFLDDLDDNEEAAGVVVES